jgi:hypothetical protein
MDRIRREFELKSEFLRRPHEPAGNLLKPVDLPVDPLKPVDLPADPPTVTDGRSESSKEQQDTEPKLMSKLPFNLSLAQLGNAPCEASRMI